MAFGWRQSIPKLLLISINLIFLLAALSVLALGIVLALAPTKVASLAESHGLNIAILSNASNGFMLHVIKACGVFMISSGLGISIITFVGLFGASYGSRCLLGIYATVLTIVILCQISAVITASFYPNTAKEQGGVAFYKALQRSFTSDVHITDDGKIENSTLGPVDVAWVTVQIGLQCCGARGYKDYELFNWTKCGKHCPDHSKVPLSCCTLRNGVNFPTSLDDFRDVKACMAMTPNKSAANRDGCAWKVAEVLADLVHQYVNIAIGITAAILNIEVILVVLAVVLACSSNIKAV